MGPTVLIVDDGFDLSLPVFKNKVVASYTIVCSDPPAPATPDGGAAIPDSEKGRAIASLLQRDERCRLQPGVVAKPDPMPSVARFKSRWNKMIAEDKAGSDVFTGAERMELAAAFKAGLNTARIHGSATASVIATLNPNARLVLVELQLSTKAAVESAFTCLDQAAIDSAVLLYTDPEFRSAFATRPVSRIDADIATLYTKHHIGIVNNSFGELPRATLEGLQSSKQCPPVKLEAWYAARAELSRLREAAAPPPNILIVRSAGNDSASIDRSSDDASCFVSDILRLTVGAPSKFSNRGGCVDLHAPGEDIVGSLPGNWQFPLSGTSFSAPLVARLLSQEIGEGGFTPASARAHAMAQPPQGSKDVPESRFPAELLYRPPGNVARALSLEGPSGELRHPGAFDLIDPRAATWPFWPRP